LAIETIVHQVMEVVGFVSFVSIGMDFFGTYFEIGPGAYPKFYKEENRYECDC
jgi:hypothetical protein